MYRMSVLAFAALVLAGCRHTPATSPSGSLVGTAWRLQTIRTSVGAIIAVESPDRYTLAFAGDTRVSVTADCNVCTGGVAFATGSLRIGPLACTRAFCGPASRDTLFLQALDEARRYAVSGDTLTLEGGDMALTLKR